MRTLTRLFFLSALVFTLGTGRAEAQVTPDTLAARVPVWAKYVGEQLTKELDSPDPNVRAAAMQHLAYFASFYGHALDLKAAVPKLLEIYESENDDRNRLFALATLHAIGDEDAMQKIRHRVTFEESPTIQLVTLAALMDHYGPATFEGDELTAQLAKELFNYYTQPHVIVGPPVVLHPEQ
ncbi:HEAT repeat domain-containing protein [Rhodocaloribacter sp.]